MTRRGCILVGDHIKDNMLLYSTTAYQRLYDLLYNTLKTEKVFIEILDIPKLIDVMPDIPKPVELPKEINLPEVIIEPKVDIKQEVKPVKLTWIEILINIIKQWINKR